MAKRILVTFVPSLIKRQRGACHEDTFQSFSVINILFRRRHYSQHNLNSVCFQIKRVYFINFFSNPSPAKMKKNNAVYTTSTRGSSTDQENFTQLIAARLLCQHYTGQHFLPLLICLFPSSVKEGPLAV